MSAQRARHAAPRYVGKVSLKYVYSAETLYILYRPLGERFVIKMKPATAVRFALLFKSGLMVD